MKKLIIALSLSLISSLAINAVAQNPSVTPDKEKKECCKDKKECKEGKKDKKCKKSGECNKKGKRGHGEKKGDKFGKKGDRMKRGGDATKFGKENLFEDLNLTADQKAKVEKLMKNNREKSEKIRTKADADGKKVRDSFKKEVKKILSDEQYKKFEEKMKNRKDHGMRHRGDMDGKNRRGEELKVTPAPGK